MTTPTLDQFIDERWSGDEPRCVDLRMWRNAVVNYFKITHCFGNIMAIIEDNDLHLPADIREEIDKETAVAEKLANDIPAVIQREAVLRGIYDQDILKDRYKTHDE